MTEAEGHVWPQSRRERCRHSCGGDQAPEACWGTTVSDGKQVQETARRQQGACVPGSPDGMAAAQAPDVWKSARTPDFSPRCPGMEGAPPTARMMFAFMFHFT